MICAAAILPSNAIAQTNQPPAMDRSAQSDYLIETLAERRVTALPEGELYWRIETFRSAADAAKAASSALPFALAASVGGRHWLFTLGPKAMASHGRAPVAQLGPVAVPAATIYLLRINRAGGPPGSKTPVHSHPGSEAIYVLKGKVTQRTAHGTEVARAGQTLNAHAPEMVMQLQSTGESDLEQLVMFVVDAERPFSPPAQFDAPPAK